MKILKIIANGFKNCEDNFEISFLPITRKTAEDKEYELEKIADELYAFSTVGIVGKNASGKTSILDLISVCYEMIGFFRITKKKFFLGGVALSVFFYYEGNIYKYETKLLEDILNDKITFKDQKIYRKKYYKSNLNSIFDFKSDDRVEIDGELPEDTSILFFELKKMRPRSIYCSSFDFGIDAYKAAFMAKNAIGFADSIFEKILKIFDENISSLEMIDDHNYKLIFCDKELILSEKDLYYRISSGTTKGLALYTAIVLSLQQGVDLIIDEIENHFHKSLVENIISLYKDKSINKQNATLIFSTHYCELLDLFNRQDNIYIAKSDEKVRIYNMYEDFDVRSELLKSKQFYSNVFMTAVNYDALMDLKRELRK